MLYCRLFCCVGKQFKCSLKRKTRIQNSMTAGSHRAIIQCFPKLALQNPNTVSIHQLQQPVCADSLSCIEVHARPCNKKLKDQKIRIHFEYSQHICEALLNISTYGCEVMCQTDKPVCTELQFHSCFKLMTLFVILFPLLRSSHNFNSSNCNFSCKPSFSRTGQE